MIDVFVIAAVRLYRDGLADALARDGRIEITGTASSWREGLARIEALGRPPDVLLVDPGAADAAGLRPLQAAHPALRVIALAVRVVDEDVVAWAEAGVAGVATRDTSLEELVALVEEVARGDTTVTSALLRRVAALTSERPRATEPRTPLTSRERQIVGLLDDGLSNKEIASRLCIELATVKNHVHNILEKLHVQRRVDAGAAARRLDLR